ncbi:PqiC family protein [Dyella telluris]|uniref:Membrane integrity-associated transporter subunit PqiC n=1 Tax=Dyella telluris TaxID=2763498 RepID=A0A7G8Q149_9GAMM|nr:PqiC family protein [Dyella telluris]QNK00507.1 membrane integrity-associated transporter subunit PqiC [Dyella telluris]
MNRWGTLNVAIATLALVLGACGSVPPVRYYTLVPPAGGDATAAPATQPFQFELLPVTVPAQVDQPQMVVRQGGQGVAMLQGQRWIAPLGDEVRGALSADLTREFRAQDVTGLPTEGKSTVRIKLDLRRFDSVPGSYAYIDAAWSVRPLKGGDPLACTSRISETVGEGYDALVQGHQEAINKLAGQVGAVAGAIAAGQPARCPEG